MVNIKNRNLRPNWKPLWLGGLKQLDIRQTYELNYYTYYSFDQVQINVWPIWLHKWNMYIKKNTYLVSAYPGWGKHWEALRGHVPSSEIYFIFTSFLNYFGIFYHLNLNLNLFKLYLYFFFLPMLNTCL